MSGTRNGAKKPTVDLAENKTDKTLLGATAALESATNASTPKNTAKPAKKVKYPCGKCNAEVSCGVACNSCELWFHNKCVEGMTKEYFNNCQKTQYIHLHGFSVFASVKKALRETKSELKAVMDWVVMLKLEKEAMAQKVEKIEKGAEMVTERVDVVAKEVASGMEIAKEEVKNDVKTVMAEREERGNNIIIYGLEETKEEDTVKWREEENKSQGYGVTIWR